MTDSSDSSSPQPFSLSESSVPLFNNGNGAVYRHALGAVLWAMVFNLVIAGLKLFVATTLTPSTALFSEGLHSLADGVNSVTLLVGILQGKRPPDKTHPYGYGLETNFWALFASFVLFVSAIWAVWQGIERFSEPTGLQDTLWAAVILIVSLVLEVFALRIASRAVLEEVGVPFEGFASIPKAFRHIRQVVGPTTRFVFYEDALAFLGALVALLAITAGSWLVALGWVDPAYSHWPDAIGSILVGIMLLILAVNLVRYNREVLIGASASPKVEKQIRDFVLKLHGVSEVHDLKTIDQGMSGLIIHMTVEVEPETQVKDVDDLTERIKTKLQERIPNVQQVLIEVLADETEDRWSRRFLRVVDIGQREEILKPREAEMLKNVYHFTNLVVEDIMVPRTDVAMVELSMPLAEVVKEILACGHSRLPVYEESVDHVVGIVHARDVFEHMHQKKLETPLSNLVREVDIYPINKPVSDLLEDFKRNKIRMAALADEHGGFVGIVTIEDLLEEIVGDIWDEGEVDDYILERLAPNQILVSGKYEVEDLNKELGLAFPDDEFKTIGGFVFGLLGREPEYGDEVEFEDLTLRVNETEGPRIVTVTVTKPTPFEEPSPRDEGAH